MSNPTPILKCFYCKTSFGGDPRSDFAYDAACPHCNESPLMFVREHGGAEEEEPENLERT